MTTATAVYTKRVIIAEGTENAAGAVTRGTLTLGGAFGGFLTVKITNFTTGPTAQAVMTLLSSHEDTLPAAGAAGSDWKTVEVLGGGGTVANVMSEFEYHFSGLRHIEVECSGNTGQKVTIEALLTEFSSVSEA